MSALPFVPIKSMRPLSLTSIGSALPFVSNSSMRPVGLTNVSLLSRVQEKAGVRKCIVMTASMKVQSMYLAVATGIQQR